MKIFVAASYSSQVDYETLEVFPEYRDWLEGNLSQLEKFGHTVFCALRADDYKMNDVNPAEAFGLDERQIKAADAMIAFVSKDVSAGVQTEIGMAIAQKKPVVFVHDPEEELAWFNQAIVLAGQANEATLPLDSDPFVGK